MSEHEATLSALVNDLAQGPRDTHALVEALSAPRAFASLVSAAQFAQDRYTRVRLFRSEDFEVRLLCWRPGQSSALHGHGTSACAFRVLSGEATEWRLGHPTRVLRPGDVGSAETDVVHQVANVGTEDVITLHVYSPPLPVDQPSVEEGHRVVIVGGGFCGAAMAMHLLESASADLRITIVESSDDLGRGVAYAKDGLGLLLNVGAGRMSVDPRHPDEFLTYARERGYVADERTLLPRELYGDYVVDRLARVVREQPGKLRIVQGRAVDTVRTQARWRVVLEDGRELPADEVVLATGHGPMRTPEGFSEAASDPRMVREPLRPGALDVISPDEDVLLVGTGLTALDVWTTLRKRGHRGHITAMSRHGKWPRPHLPTGSWTGKPYLIDVSVVPRDAASLARWLTAEIARAERNGCPWQAVIEGLTPHVATLWSRLPKAERGVFLREHRPTWEVLRHRAPQPLHDALCRAHRTGTIRTRRGSIERITRREEKLVVTLRAGDRAREVVVDRVLLCTGAESDVTRFGTPLWNALLRRGHVLPDAWGLGIVTDEAGAVVGSDGAVDGIWAIGAMRRPRLFETTAVPHLVPQLRDIAWRIVAGEGLVRTLRPSSVGSQAPAAR